MNRNGTARLLLGIVLGTAVLLAGPGLPAASAFEIHLLGGIDSSRVSNGGYGANGLPTVLSVSPEAGPAGGLAFVTPLSSSSAFEVDLLALERHDSYAFPANGQLDQSRRMVEVPILYRVYPSRLFSLAAGLYEGRYLGTTTSLSGASNMSSGDFGFVFGVGMDFPITDGWAVIIDGRFTWGLTNNSGDSGASISYNDILLFTGFRFGNMW